MVFCACLFSAEQIAEYERRVATTHARSAAVSPLAAWVPGAVQPQAALSAPSLLPGWGAQTAPPVPSGPKAAPLAPQLRQPTAAECAAVLEEVCAGVPCIRGPNGVRMYTEDVGQRVNDALWNRGIRFVDPEFDVSVPWVLGGRPAAPGVAREHILPSVMSGQHAQTANELMYSKPVHWLRVSEPQHFAVLQGQPPVLFDDTVGAHDIKQGVIANCWMCAEFAAVAHARPDAVKNAFFPARPSLAGCYSVRLFLQGFPYYLLIDDYVGCLHPSPADPPGTSFSMQSANSAEMWPRLLEKAFGKLAGGMIGLACNIQGAREEWDFTLGTYAPAVRGITGAPDGRRVNWDEGSERTTDLEGDERAQLDKFREESWIRTASCCKAKLGLVDDHCYSVLWSGKVGSYYFLCLRNPWGNKEWTGDWSDQSKLWDKNKSVKAKLIATGLFHDQPGIKAPAFASPGHVASADDGAFLMELRDFEKYFGGVQGAGPLDKTHGFPGHRDMRAEMMALRDRVDHSPLETREPLGAALPINHLGGVVVKEFIDFDLYANETPDCATSLKRIQQVFKAGSENNEVWLADRDERVVVEFSEDVVVSGVTVCGHDGKVVGRIAVTAMRDLEQRNFPWMLTPVADAINEHGQEEFVVTFPRAVRTKLVMITFFDKLGQEDSTLSIIRLLVHGEPA